MTALLCKSVYRTRVLTELGKIPRQASSFSNARVNGLTGDGRSGGYVRRL